MLVERTVSRWKDGGWVSEGERLADLRSARGYVLLGEPGSGKSTAFEEEAKKDEDAGDVTARRFTRRSLDAHPEWRGRTLFIDGLDEVRARGGDLREPVDTVVCRLEELGKPRFRLSCREDSWLGRSDFRELSTVVDGEELHLLRLDPISRQDARSILAASGVPDPDGFLCDAVDRGLEVFLQNPLLLDILCRARDSATWPVGRLATFQRACEALARETNRDHLDARDGEPFASEEVVLAAGRLCAILLLTGSSGWSRRGPGDDECPALSEAGEEQALLKFALDTKLFVGSAETGRTWRHRQIAEFLASRYLDHAIREHHVPAGRVLAWMRGIDGIVMPDLRGVSVWLAAGNPDTRRTLIELDPVGLAFHGDAGGFSPRETALLLNGLETELDYRLRTQQWEGASPASLGALMAGPARSLLWDLLRDAERSQARQVLVQVLLRGLAATPLGASSSPETGIPLGASEAREMLPAVIRNATWEQTARRRALAALIHLVGKEDDGPATASGLLREFDEGRIPEDEGAELRGQLLTYLYPCHFAAEDIWDHAKHIWDVDTRTRNDPPVSPVPRGRAERFWTAHLVDESESDDVRTLLDTLVPRAEELIPLLAQNEVESVVLGLLTRGLELFGAGMGVTRLYQWFELVEVDYEIPGLVPAHCRNTVLRSPYTDENRRIYRWLRDHPDMQLALLLEGLERNAFLPRDRMLDQEIGVKFLGDEGPHGFRVWCLNTAVDKAEELPRVAIELAFWAVTERRNEWGPPLRDEEVVAAVRHTPLLMDWHERRVTAEASLAEKTRRLQSERYMRFQARRQADLLAIRENLATIETGHGQPGMLHELGGVYRNGLRIGGADRARSRLVDHLGGDEKAFRAVIRGFRRLVGRTDLPDLNEIVRLHEQGMMSSMAFPFLAGLAEDEEAGVDPLEGLDEDGLRRALGFYLLSGLPTTRHPIPRLFSHSEDARPKWYRHSLETRPQAVSDAFVAVHRARVRAKESPDQHLYDLSRAEEYAEVARLAVPRMFTPFPSCCTEPQVVSLRLVLWTALKYVPPDDLRRLLQRRLLRRGMDPAQRACWLGAGLFVEREACLPALVDFVSSGRDREGKAGDLVNFLVPDRKPLGDQEWPTADLIALVRAVGTRLSSPWERRGSSGHFFGDSFAIGTKVDALVNNWLDTVAGRVDEDALAGLRSLADDPELKSWRGRLLRASDDQAWRRRMEAHTPPSLPEIRNALSGGPPAGVADLAALVSDKLRALADRIRDGNTDPWQQYWHTDPDDPRGRMVLKPKSEDPCRDALLSDLQFLLEPHDVDAQPEGHHAEDARSDIIAVHGTRAVVVEIKKTDSKDLWTAIEDQLIARYTRDPRSGGYGIFLVLWFGADHLRRSPPSGTRPRSPEELQRMLEGLLTHEQRRTITVTVADVSAPAGRVASRLA